MYIERYSKHMRHSKKTVLLFSAVAVLSLHAGTTAHAKEASSVSKTKLSVLASSESSAFDKMDEIEESDLLEETDGTLEEESSIEEEDIIFDELTDEDSNSSNGLEKVLTVSKTSFVSDTLNGVSALYRPGKSDGTNATYSCAAFIKRYYTKVYGIGVNNLLYKRTPNAIGSDKFIKVTEPQVGDIVSETTSHGTTHWSIVKSVGENKVTVIEQNWKWRQNGTTYTRVNRSVKNSAVTFYRLKSVNDSLSK